MTKTNKKTNTGCLKMLKIIMLLYEDKAYYDDVINIIKEGCKDPSISNIQVMLNKYLNSLKVAGMKIVKDNNKYKLDSNLYSMNYSKEDIESIAILLSSCENFPDLKIKNNINELLQNLQLRMTNADKTKLYELTTKQDFSFYYSDMLTQIENAQKMCQSDRDINITYIQKGEILNSKGKAKELLYDSKNAYLRLYDTNSKENKDIPLQNIMNYEESPLKSKNMESTTTVVFELTGRLAKTYKLKEGEHIQSFENGILTVVNNDEPIEKLFSRLMRYSYNCKIRTPKFLRKQMEELIEKTLKKYEKN